MRAAKQAAHLLADVNAGVASGEADAVDHGVGGQVVANLRALAYKLTTHLSAVLPPLIVMSMKQPYRAKILQSVKYANGLDNHSDTTLHSPAQSQEIYCRELGQNAVMNSPQDKVSLY